MVNMYWEYDTKYHLWYGKSEYCKRIVATIGSFNPYKYVFLVGNMDIYFSSTNLEAAKTIVEKIINHERQHGTGETTPRTSHKEYAV